MFAEASWHVFILCVVVALFMLWVMTLKKQIIAILATNQALEDENRKLKDMLLDRPPADAAYASQRSRQSTEIQISK